MYKFDTHVHTAESSHCANLPAKEMLELYIKAGYSGICVTDHYDKHTFRRRGSLPWERHIDCFLKGYRKAAEAAGSTGFTVLLGAEVKLGDSENDLLLYGLTERFFYENPKLYDYDFGGFCGHMKKNGILVFQAHPFRPEISRENPCLLDGVEILNANPRHNSNNDSACGFAEKNGLLVSAGSDTHRAEDVGRSGILTAKKINSPGALKAVLTSGGFSIIVPY